MAKKVIAVLVLLMLVCGGAFGIGFGGVIGWAAFVSGGVGTMYGLGTGTDFTLSLCTMGGGLFLLLLDLVLSDSGSSTAQAPSENPLLEHVSFGVAPNAVYAGVNFHF